jgi:hypothetical protein
MQANVLTQSGTISPPPTFFIAMQRSERVARGQSPLAACLRR